MSKPTRGDYSPYQEDYINTVDGDNILEILENQLKSVPEFLSSIPAEKENHSYAEGKWTVKQLIEHITDTERIFAYRALCIARSEKKVLPGFEQDDYAAAANSNERNLVDLIEEFRKVREANLSLFKSFSEEVINKKGNVNDYQITVNAILYVIAGHLNHHINILKDKYLN